MENVDNSVDLIIRNARLIDGSGNPSRPGAVAIRDDRIHAVGDVDGLSAGVEIDAGGQALAPGFIDVHTHDDRALLSNPLMQCKLSQGVTTVVTGNCGVSLAPLKLSGRPPPPLDLIGDDGARFYSEFGDYLAALDADPPALNALCQVGHSSLRVDAMGLDLDRPASGAEIVTMRGRLETALDAGAAGLSSGLFYAPAAAAPTAEVIELARALRAAGALHTTHMRDESDGVFDSLEETFKIGRDADVPVVISHHKCAGSSVYGRSAETLAAIDAAAAQQPVALDAYPYHASSTVLDMDRMMGASRVIVTWSEPHPELAGRDLSDIAAEWDIELRAAADRLQPAGAIYFSMDEADVQRILAHPRTMIGSDGLPHDAHPHPRLWGTFPRVLGHYARDVGLFSLEQAVHKMTGLSAARFGLRERGRLAVGCYADLVLFDPDTVNERGSWADPAVAAAGIEQVWVNGRSVWQDGAATGTRPGRALRLGVDAKAADAGQF